MSYRNIIHFIIIMLMNYPPCWEINTSG